MRVLVVDDVAINRKLLRLTLVSAGHEATEAADGVEALKALRAGGFDAVISDVLMPRMDGYRLCQEVRRSEGLEAMPFIIYTSTYTSPSDEKLALSVGADKFLTKPAPAEAILAALEEARVAPRPVRDAEPPTRELDVLKQYSEALVRKLEHKNQELEASERRYRELVDSAPIGVLQTSPEGQFVSANAAFARILGYESPADLVPLDFAADVFREPSEYVDFLKRVEGSAGTLEVRLKRREGSVWVEADGRAVKNDTGQTIRYEIFARDVSARKIAEEEVKRPAAAPAPGRRARITRDVAVAAAVAVGVATLTHHLLRREYLWLDDVIAVLVAIAAVVSVFSYRRLKVVRNEVMAREGVERALRFLRGDLENRVEARTLELRAANESLRTEAEERRNAETDMRRSEERFRRLFESNTIGIVVANLAGEAVEANDVYLSMLGYTRDELVAGRIRWDELTPSEYRERDRVAVEQLQRTGVASPWEKELRRKDGTTVPILIGVAMLGESEGRCLAYVVDLTDRRRAEKSVRASEERYRLLFDSNPQAMWVFDDETLAFLAVNDAACRHYGYSREEFLGMTIEDIRPSEDVPALRRLLESGSREHHEAGVWKHRKKDGALIEVEISTNPLVLDGRRAHLVMAVDVTERRLLEQQFRQAQKMEAIGQLAGGVAHDFNNLLTVILGFTDFVATEVGADSPVMESIEEIRKAGERAVSLTRQLLTFSRRQVLEPIVLDLNALITNIDRMLQRLIGEDVALVTALGDVGRIRADSGQIEQIVLNLAVNSRDAMPKGGKLTIETANVELDGAYASEHVGIQPGTYVMLAVTDTGTGMNTETKTHMFEPFFTTKGLGKGTGLGLATVYGIVKQSGGTIWVYSEPDRGTTFKIYFPLVEETSDAVQSLGKESRPANGSETVLLVEDEPAVRILTRKILLRYGYSVVEVSSGSEALEAARRRESPIDLLLTDVVMPDMGGPDLATRIQSIRPGIRVLFMSGYTDDAIVRHGILTNGVSFLQKPFTPEVLARKIREVLDRKP